MDALTLLQEAAERFPGVVIESADVEHLRPGLARLTVTGEGSLDGSTKALLLYTLRGVELPGVGKVTEVRLQIDPTAWAVAMLDLHVKPQPIPNAALSPFGGPMKLSGRQLGALYRRGFPLPPALTTPYPFEFVAPAAPESS